MANPAIEAQQFSAGSIAFARGIGQATTEALYGERLAASDRRDLRRLWDDLRSR